MSVLEVKDLTVRYGNVTAVDGINFSVEEGEFVTLLGPSGCGKTSTLRCIAGLERAAEGEIRIAGDIVSSSDGHVRTEERDINMVFQSYAVWPHMSVFENVAYGLRVRRRPKDELKERVHEALELVGLSGYADRYGTELSGGQQQRVALARAVVTQPKILLFDEPLSNLDAGLRERMRHELADLQRRIGKTAIYVTHDQSEAMVMSDRVVLMNEGRIEQMAEPEVLYRRPCSRFAGEFIGSANVFDATVDAVDGRHLTARLSQGITVDILTPEATSASPGDRGTILLRPEDLEVLPTTTAPSGLANDWEVTVRRTAFLGDRRELYLDVAGFDLRAEVDASTRVEDGGTVRLTIAPELAIWVDPAASGLEMTTV